MRTPTLIIALLSSCSAAVNAPGDQLPSGPAGQTYTVQLPAGARGFTIVVRGEVTNSDFIGVETLTSPSGAAVIRDFKSVAHPGRSLTGHNGTGLGVVPIPLLEDGAAQVQLESGQWTLRLGGQSGDAKNPKAASTPFTGMLRGTVLVNAGTEPGTLDLDVWVPEGLVTASGTVSATTALSDAAIAERLDTGFSLLARLTGVQRGVVRAHALPARFLVLGDDAAIDAAMRSLEPVPLAAQLVLTNSLTPSGGGEISGVSPCLPGAPATGGTGCSGFVWSLRQGSVAWQDASGWLHELSHFLGLRHTTELDTPPSFDGLMDTPDCADTSKSALARCPDRNNLMFPSVNQADGLDALTLSETQRAAWRASALVH